MSLVEGKKKLALPDKGSLRKIYIKKFPIKISACYLSTKQSYPYFFPVSKSRITKNAELGLLSGKGKDKTQRNIFIQR